MYNNGPVTVDANESKPYNPTNFMIYATFAVFAVMLLTGHILPL